MIKISDNVSPVFDKYFLNKKTYNIAAGGRAGFKSTTHGIELALMALEKPNSDIIVMREHYKDHRDSTFYEIINGFKRLGIKLLIGIHYPRGNSLWIKIPNGSRFRFYGGVSNDFENLKGIVPTPGNKIIALWFFEITQFKNAYGMNQIVSSFIRGEKEEFYIFQEYNPPEQKSHWVYEYVNSMKVREDVNYIFVNYCDHPIELQEKWIGKIALREIEALKQIDEAQYRNIYLGEAVSLGGRIYKNFNRDVCCVDELPYRLEDYFVIINCGLDVGFHDKFCVTATLIKSDMSEIYIAEELVIDNTNKKIYNSLSGMTVSGAEKDPNECIKETVEFLNRVSEKYNKRIMLYIESADKGFRMTMEKYIILNKIQNIIPKAVNKTKRFEKSESAIKERIMFGNIIIGANALKINRKCKYIVYAFEDATYNKYGERQDDSTTDWNDSLDSFEYSILERLKDIQNKVMYNAGVKIVEKKLSTG